MDRVRVPNRAGRICAVIDRDDVAGVHCNPEDGVSHVEVVYRSGSRVELINVEPSHVLDTLFPEPDERRRPRPNPDGSTDTAGLSGA